jgi:hypothetical protein
MKINLKKINTIIRLLQAVALFVMVIFLVKGLKLMGIGF